MEFIVTSGKEYSSSLGSISLMDRLKEIAVDRPGYCYFRFPIAGLANVPDILVFDERFGIVSIAVKDYTIEDIEEVSNDFWKIKGEEVDSPLLEVEDYYFALITRYQKSRTLRKKLTPKEKYFNNYFYFANMVRSQFTKKFPDFDSATFIFSDELPKLEYLTLWKNRSDFSEEEGQLFISYTQGISVIKKADGGITKEPVTKIGDAISLIERQIALMDKGQHRAAIQIPEGPQIIRGMAGTGKTIILAMKAAYLHFKYPDKKILFTFNTHSLYGVSKNLIKKFYALSAEVEPDWSKLLLMHSWGGKTKEGVYYRICMRNSIPPRQYLGDMGVRNSFDILCRDVLTNKLQQEFDYVLVDEAQDFPQSFFELLWMTTKDPHSIILAYDELQSLANVEFPDVDELFGRNQDGTKRVDFSKGTYDNGIEMEYILDKSYRNPIEVLMVAHGLGLGIHNKAGIMQMIDNPKVWETIGYVLKEGSLVPGQKVVLERPSENSVSLVNELYSGDRAVLTYSSFATREDEITDIAERIVNDVTNEDVPPEQIIVISLDEANMFDDFINLQKKLFDKGILSVIPGKRGVAKDVFAESGKVTLSTVFKAKGNEAYMVYIMRFDYLYDYEDFLKARNRAFTTITRSKGWCHISGVGANMERAIEEIKLIEREIPQFKFEFPNPSNIKRKLQTEQLKRKAESRRAKEAIQQVQKVDAAVLESVFGKMSRKEKREFLAKMESLMK